MLGLDHRQRRPQPDLPAVQRGHLPGLLGAGQPRRAIIHSVRVRVLGPKRHQL